MPMSSDAACCGWFLLPLALSALLMGGTAQAGTVQVNNLLDSGAGSLRDAIALANAGDDIVFAPGLTGTVYLATRLLINKSLHVVGYGIALDGGDSVKVLNMQAGAVVTLDGLTVQHGRSADGGAILVAATVVMNDCSVHDNRADNNGGAIYVGTGSLTLNDTNVYNNMAVGQGGGIRIENAATTRLNHSNVFGNQAGSLGGGISQTSGSSLDISFSRITGNTVYGSSSSGGGIHVEDSLLIVRDSTVSNNSAGFAGGGIYVRQVSLPTTLQLIRSVVSSNTAIADGGGVLVSGATMIGTNSTIAYNSSQDAARSGGGIWMDAASVTALTHTTVAFNRAYYSGGIRIGAGSLSLKNSIVAGNIVISASPDVDESFTSLGYNLVQTHGASTGYIASDLPNGTNPAFNSSFGQYGGPTNILPLLGGSAAINAVAAANCAAEDQRSYRRTGTCDIGAYDTEGVAALFADGFGW